MVQKYVFGTGYHNYSKINIDKTCYINILIRFIQLENHNKVLLAANLTKIILHNTNLTMVDRSNPVALGLLYGCLSISIISSSTNIIIIIVEKLVSDRFASIIFLMQCCSLILALIDISFYPSIDMTICRVESSLYYGFMTSEFLLLSYFLFKIYKTLCLQKTFLKKYNKCILLAIFIIPISYSFISFNTYTPCGYSNFEFYCGICSKDIPLWNRVLVSFNYAVPAAAGIAMYIVLAIYQKQLDYSLMQSQQKLALKIIWIPVVNIIYMTLTGLVTIILNTTGSDYFYVFFILNFTWTIIPSVNLFFYMNFAFHWSVTHKKKLRCWNCFVFRKSSQQDMLNMYEYSNVQDQ